MLPRIFQKTLCPIYLVFPSHTQFSVPRELQSLDCEEFKELPRHFILLSAPSEPSCAMQNSINLELKVITFRQVQSRGQSEGFMERGKLEHYSKEDHSGNKPGLLLTTLRMSLKGFKNHFKPLCMKKLIGKFTGFGK